MKIVGLIAEYNPLHRGHCYQLQEIRRQELGDLIICVMSGNVVQRGEFAVVDKWLRAQAAVQSGADLVIELPLLASLQAADYFAAYAVDLVSRLGCERLVFGTESASREELEDYLYDLQDHSLQIDAQTQVYLGEGLAYPAAVQQARLDILGRAGAAMDQPNHLLALQYLKHNRQLREPLEIIALPRVQGQPYLSGSQIRQAWQSGALPGDAVAPALVRELEERQPVTWADYWPYLRYQLTCHTPASLSEIYQVREGLEHRLLSQLGEATSYSDYLDRLISKRWTRSALQRILMVILLNITDRTWTDYRATYDAQPLARILSYNDRGQAYLRSHQALRMVELFGNMKQSLHDRYALMLRADAIYQQLPAAKIAEQATGRYPIFLKNNKENMSSTNENVPIFCFLTCKERE